MTRIIPSLLALTGAAALSACAQSAEDTAATDDRMAAETDTMAEQPGATAAAGEAEARQFLMNAMRGDNAEIEAGRLAAEEGSTDAVREYGEMLVQEHGAHKAQVAQVGQAFGVQPMDEPTPEGAQLMTRLQDLSGAEFDRAFAQGMVESHRRSIAMYEQQQAVGGPEQVATLVRESLPVLRRHLERAEALTQ